MDPSSLKRCRNSSGMMALDGSTNAGVRAGREGMASDLLQTDRVDNDFALGDAHGEDLTNVRPRHGVQVESMREVALDAHVAINDLGGVEVAPRQGQQVRLFALMTLPRRFLEVAQDTDISDVGQPPSGHLVEMLQRVEGAAVE
jgi:hypothetical protein